MCQENETETFLPEEAKVKFFYWKKSEMRKLGQRFFFLFRVYESNCSVTIIYIFYIIVYITVLYFILSLFEIVWISIQLSAITSFFMGLVPFYTCLAVFHLLVGMV